MMQILQPPSWARPKGFSNGIAVKGGTTVYIAGQVGWTGDCRWESTDFGGQFHVARIGRGGRTAIDRKALHFRSSSISRAVARALATTAGTPAPGWVPAPTR